MTSRPPPTLDRRRGARPRRGSASRPSRPSRGLRVADVAMFYGARSGGIRTYIDAKAAWARETPEVDHHVIVPGPRARDHEGWHELRSLRVAAANGYRLPVGAGALKAKLRALRPDVVLLHDPFWRPLGVTEAAQALGARVIAVHHGSIALDAAGLPGPDALWDPVLRAWMHHAYRDVDAVMSAVPCRADCGRDATIPLRFGLHPAFVPHPGTRRGDHVLYVGRVAREKGVTELIRAAARSSEPWPLRLVGSGPAEQRLTRLAARLRIADRVALHPYITDRETLAATYAAARVVVMPGAHETFGLAGFEAAASGAAVVCCATAPSARLMAGLVHTYQPGDVDGLLAAVEAARRSEPDPVAAAALAARATWAAAFAAETAALERLVAGPRRTG